VLTAVVRRLLLRVSRHVIYDVCDEDLISDAVYVSLVSRIFKVNCKTAHNGEQGCLGTMPQLGPEAKPLISGQSPLSGGGNFAA